MAILEKAEEHLMTELARLTGQPASGYFTVAKLFAGKAIALAKETMDPSDFEELAANVIGTGCIKLINAQAKAEGELKAIATLLLSAAKAAL